MFLICYESWKNNYSFLWKQLLLSFINIESLLKKRLKNKAEQSKNNLSVQLYQVQLNNIYLKNLQLLIIVMAD